MIFTREGDTYVPSEDAVGPWDPGQLHGGPACGLLATELQALAPEHQLARCTFEFLGPVPLAPLELAARLIKPGRRFQLAEAELTVDGRRVLLARAGFLRRSDPMELPPAARPASGLPCRGPEASAPEPGAWEVSPGQRAFHITGMELRSPPEQRQGRTRVWFRLAGELVAGTATAAITRAVAAADFANGISVVVSFATHVFVNTDLTVALLRDPVGPWVLLDAETRIDPAGIGRAAATLYDELGPIGTAQQTLFVQER
ncbi:MAG: thioesterase family protein [Solirubrobacterales bacterium]|nr:thioesterase family protein [Solirubrobacterales bacterium]